MKRTQIQLDEGTFETLRRRAFRERRSIADVVREILRGEVRPSPKGDRLTLKSFSFIGRGASRGKGAGTVSLRHDEEFAETLRK